MTCVRGIRDYIQTWLLAMNFRASWRVLQLTEDNRETCLVGLSGSNTNLKRGQCISSADCWWLVVAHTIYKMLHLSAVGVTEPLHQVRYDIVLGTTARQQHDRRVLVNTNGDCSLGTKHLCTYIVAVECVAAHFDGA